MWSTVNLFKCNDLVFFRRRSAVWELQCWSLTMLLTVSVHPFPRLNSRNHGRASGPVYTCLSKKIVYTSARSSDRSSIPTSWARSFKAEIYSRSCRIELMLPDGIHPCNLHDLVRISWVGSVVCRSWIISRSWSIWSICPQCEIISRYAMTLFLSCNNWWMAVRRSLILFQICTTYDLYFITYTGTRYIFIVIWLVFRITKY